MIIIWYKNIPNRRIIEIGDIPWQSSFIWSGLLILKSSFDLVRASLFNRSLWAMTLNWMKFDWTQFCNKIIKWTDYTCHCEYNKYLALLQQNYWIYFGSFKIKIFQILYLTYHACWKPYDSGYESSLVVIFAYGIFNKSEIYIQYKTYEIFPIRQTHP